MESIEQGCANNSAALIKKSKRKKIVIFFMGVEYYETSFKSKKIFELAIREFGE